MKIILAALLHLFFIKNLQRFPLASAESRQLRGDTNYAADMETKAAKKRDPADFVICWADDKDENRYYEIFLAGFSNNGKKVLNDMTVNSVSSGQQKEPQVSLNNYDEAVVVWEDDKDDNGWWQIHARGISTITGNSIFSDIVVNVEGSGDQVNPDIASNPWGNFVVVWQDDKDKNDYWEIFARGFSWTGKERIPTFTVNTVSSGQQYTPQVAMAQNGDFVVVWTDDQDGNGYYEILMRGFYSNGSERFSTRKVNRYSAGQQVRPRIDMEADGNFVIVYMDDMDGNKYWQIHAVGYYATGIKRFNDIVVNVIASGQQLYPDVAIDKYGNFVVVWEDDLDQNGYYEIFLRGFYSNGIQRLSTRTVNKIASGQQRKPRVDMGKDGTFTVVYMDDNDQNGYWQIHARGYTTWGWTLFNPITVNTVASGQQRLPSISEKLHYGY